MVVLVMVVLVEVLHTQFLAHLTTGLMDKQVVLVGFRCQFTVNIEGASWSTLINGINDQYRSSFNRPPTVDEMDYWIGEYISYNADTVSQLRGWIAGGSAYNSSTGAVSYCGKTL
jgi:hypothetical protein